MVRPGPRFAKISEAAFEVQPDSRADLDLLFTAVEKATGVPTAVVHLWTLDNVEKTYDAFSLMRSQVIGSQHVPPCCAGLRGSELGPSSSPLDGDGGLYGSRRAWRSASHRERPNVGHRAHSGTPASGAARHPGRPKQAPTAGEARELARQISLNGDEDRIALRGTDRYVARLAAHTSEDPESERLGDGEEYGFEIASAGVLDNLALRAFHPRPPGPGEAAIEVVASGLNFIDVAKVMGILPGLDAAEPLRLGMECAGRVVAIGDGVNTLQPGDEVIAVTPSIRHGMMALYSHASGGTCTAQARESGA